MSHLSRAAGAVVISALLLASCIEPRQHHEPGQVAASPPGSVALGEPCAGFESCAAVGGESVGCRCTDQATVPVCVTDAEEGDACSGPAVYAPCRPGTVCASGADAGAGWTCVALGGTGAPCELGTGGCTDDQYCDETGHCATRTARLGQPCLGLDAWSCQAPNVCDLDADVCVAPTPTGGSCSSIIGGRSSCGDSAFCTLSIGERDGTCEPAKADGELCFVNEECLSRICFQAVCGRGYPADAWVSCG
jgi:hypothetical protein